MTICNYSTWTDFHAFPNTNGFHPLFCEQGWAAWLKFTCFDEIADEIAHECDGRILMHGVAGWGKTKTIGYFPFGSPVTSETWNFEELAKSKVGQIYPHLREQFVDYMAPRQKAYRNLLAHIGGVDVEKPGDADAAFTPLRQSGITPIIDAEGVVASGGFSREALTGILIYGVEPGGQPEGQLKGASWSLSDSYWQSRFSRPKQPGDLLYQKYEPDPETRALKAAKAIGQGFIPCIAVKPITSAGWGEAENMTRKQVRELVRMNG